MPRMKTTLKLGEPNKEKRGKKPVNPWPYKTELPILCETNKLVMNDKPFSVKAVKSDIVTKYFDDFMYDLFGSMVNQTAVFMRQWIPVYTLTHKKLVHCTAVRYLQSKGLKLPTWLSGVKEG